MMGRTIIVSVRLALTLICASVLAASTDAHGDQDWEVPRPKDCTSHPFSKSELPQAVATPLAESSMDPEVILVAPEIDVLTGIGQSARRMVACNNAGNMGVFYTLFSKH